MLQRGINTLIFNTNMFFIYASQTTVTMFSFPSSQMVVKEEDFCKWGFD